MQVGEAKALHTAKRSSGVDTSDPELAAAWAKVRADDTPDNWCAFTYKEGSSTSLCLLGCGSSGMPELASAVNDGTVAFIGLRASVDARTRFFRVLFVGEDVGGMKKGKAALHKNAAFEVLEGAVGDLTCASLAELTADAFREDMCKLGGGSTVEC